MVVHTLVQTDRFRYPTERCSGSEPVSPLKVLFILVGNISPNNHVCRREHTDGTRVGRDDWVQRGIPGVGKPMFGVGVVFIIGSTLIFTCVDIHVYF